MADKFKPGSRGQKILGLARGSTPSHASSSPKISKEDISAVTGEAAKTPQRFNFQAAGKLLRSKLNPSNLLNKKLNNNKENVDPASEMEMSSIDKGQAVDKWLEASSGVEPLCETVMDSNNTRTGTVATLSAGKIRL